MRRAKRISSWLWFLPLLALLLAGLLGYLRWTPATPHPPHPRPVAGFLPPLSAQLEKLPEKIRVLRTKKKYQPAKCSSQYRGKCIETLALEDYIEGVVLAEEGIFIEQPDTLRAKLSGHGSARAAQEAWALQALAARSYALYSIASGRHRGAPYDLEDTPRDQAYAERRDPRAAAAVKRTRGLVLVDDQGRLLPAEYSASCAGTGTWSVHGEHRPIACHPRCASHAYPGSTHSRGMCQWGSFEFARDGATLEDLIQRYYPGARYQKAGRAAKTANPIRSISEGLLPL